jgi:transglutaminase-like putative cysteine protease
MTEQPRLPPDGSPTDAADPAAFLDKTYYVDFDHPAVAGFAAEKSRGAASDIDKAVRLFYAVRDEIRYDPYSLRYDRACFKASHTLASRIGWCVPKGVLMCALSRAVGIPARLGYADVRNHLSTQRIRDLMSGTDLFTWHGYVELWLGGRWVKATPVFDKALCERFQVVAQEFDGRADALFQEFDRQGRRHMDYINDRGAYDDLPYQAIIDDFEARYPKWMKVQREAEGITGDFAAEAAREKAGG